MNTYIQLNRIAKAQRAARQAQSDWAREYWSKVARELEATLT